jgi:hypothetical protein
MKTPLRTDKSLVIAIVVTVGATIILFTQHSIAAGTKHKAVFGKGIVEIHPRAKLSPDQEKALNDVLSKYPDKIYRIRTVRNGKAEVSGNLPEGKDPDTHHTIMRAQFVAELAASKLEGNDVVDEQVFCPPPCHIDNVRLSENDAEKKKVIDKLRPILEKY